MPRDHPPLDRRWFIRARLEAIQSKLLAIRACREREP
jgi:hypothetical protein